MSIFPPIHIHIEKVIIHQENDEKLDAIIAMLKELGDEETKQAILDKLKATKDDLENTV
jgi:hypothetical protein